MEVRAQDRVRVKVKFRLKVKVKDRVEVKVKVRVKVMVGSPLNWNYHTALFIFYYIWFSNFIIVIVSNLPLSFQKNHRAQNPYIHNYSKPTHNPMPHQMPGTMSISNNNNNNNNNNCIPNIINRQPCSKLCPLLFSQ